MGDVIMKKWVNNNNASFFVAGLAIYLVGLVFLGYSFKFKNIAAASTIFVIFNIVTLSIVSWFYFKETLSTPQLIGIALGMCSIIFLEMA
jgi:multidrug transporter EmrE-like cation transporter